MIAWRTRIGAIALAGFALRMLRPLALGGEGYGQLGHLFNLEIADHLLAGEGAWWAHYGREIAHRTPGYPALLALLSLAGRPWWLIALFNALFGAASVVVAAQLGRLWLGERAGIGAALAVAAYPHFVAHDAMLQDTALYTFLFGLAMLWLFRARLADENGGVARAALAGIALAAAVWVRATLVPPSLVLLAWLGWRAGARRALVAAVAFALALAPWLVRNQLRLGAPLLTSADGYSLWIATHPRLPSIFPEDSIDVVHRAAFAELPAATREELKRTDELGHRARFLEFARLEIARDPARVARTAVLKVGAAFSLRKNPGPVHPLGQLVHALGYGSALAGAIYCMTKRRRAWSDWLPVALTASVFALQCAVFWGHSAHRLFLDFFLIILAAGGVAQRRGDEGVLTQRAA